MPLFIFFLLIFLFNLWQTGTPSQISPYHTHYPQSPSLPDPFVGQGQNPCFEITKIPRLVYSWPRYKTYNPQIKRERVGVVLGDLAHLAVPSSLTWPKVLCQEKRWQSQPNAMLFIFSCPHSLAQPLLPYSTHIFVLICCPYIHLKMHKPTQHIQLN